MEVAQSVGLYSMLGWIVIELRLCRSAWVAHIEEAPRRYADKAETGHDISNLYGITNDHEKRITTMEARN